MGDRDQDHPHRKYAEKQNDCDNTDYDNNFKIQKGLQKMKKKLINWGQDLTTLS